MTTSRPVVTEIRPADEHNQVLTVVGGDAAYRRRPCDGCPWRKSQTGGFPAEAFRHSANTAEDMSRHTFGCHEAGIARPKVCAGFLLRGAEHNVSVRMKAMSGAIDFDSLVEPDDDDLHEGYISMAVANGVPREDPALERCRLSSYEIEARR